MYTNMQINLNIIEYAKKRIEENSKAFYLVSDFLDVEKRYMCEFTIIKDMLKDNESTLDQFNLIIDIINSISQKREEISCLIGFHDGDQIKSIIQTETI